MDRLTPAEEKVMLRLWKLEKATVKEIVEMYEQPKPATNTISTIIRILERKKFVKHKTLGRGYVYLPKISKEQYREYLAEHLLNNYFEGSRNEVLSFYNSSMSLSEIL